MPGDLTNEGEELALNLLLRNTGTMPSAVYLGLATAEVGETDTLSSIVEEDDANYQRLEVTLTSPAQDEDEVTYVENNNQLEFGPWDAEADSAIVSAFLTDAETGDTGTLISKYSLTNDKQPAAGESLIVTEGDCRFSLD